MDAAHTFRTPQEITNLLFAEFAAPLIISTFGFIFLGVNICQVLHYFQNVAKRDHLLTRVWVCLVAVGSLTSTLYEVYLNWLCSILLFDNAAFRGSLSIVMGNIVALYSTVIILVHFFWLSCIQKLLFAKPRLSWFIIISFGLTSTTAFILSIAVAVISRLRPGLYGSWPTDEVSILLRVVLGLDLGVDIAILLVIVSQLAALKKSSSHLKATISKLSWTLCLMTLASTLTIVGELYVNLPQSGHFDSKINIAITFAPIIPTVYAGSFFAVLNARDRLWLRKRKVRPQSDDSGRRSLIPGLKFTVDLPDHSPDNKSVSSSRSSLAQRNSSPAEPVMTFISTRRRTSEGQSA